MDTGLTPGMVACTSVTLTRDRRVLAKRRNEADWRAGAVSRIVNFFYKDVVGIGVLWWFQIYCAWSSQ